MKSPVFYFDDKRPIDLICMGRVAVDLYAEQIGTPLKNVESFKKYLGGCAGNIAVGAARLGLQCQMFSCVGQDEMGQFIKAELEREGVNTELLYETAKHLTGLVLLGVQPPNQFPLIFYRNDCADMQLQANQINKQHLTQAKAILLTGTGLSTEAMRQTTTAVAQLARQCETAVILDLDYRPVLWGLTAVGNGETRFCASEAVSAAYQFMLPLCDLLVGTEEEICIAGGQTNLNQSITTLRQLTQSPIVIKRGEKGCEVLFNESQQTLHSKAFPVEILNVLGAGDAFMAGLLAGLLQGKTWDESTTQANANGALVVTRHGCSPAMPYQDELRYFMREYENIPRLWASAELKGLHEPHNGNCPTLIKKPQGFKMGETTIVPLQSDLGLALTTIKLNQGEVFHFSTEYEFAALLLVGRVTFDFNKQSCQVARFDYFSEPPFVLHCPAGEIAQVIAFTDCEILLMQTENDHTFTPLLFDAHNALEIDARGKGLLEDTASRLVRTVFDKRNRPESNLVVGEIITFQGRWSSYPSHYHDQPEIYHYRFSEPQGYAFAEQGQHVLRVEHNDTYLIRSGDEHAHCTAPGYALYTLWFIRHLPNNPYLQPSFVKEHEWTRSPFANQRVMASQSFKE